VCVNRPDFIKYGRTVVEILQFKRFFENGGRLPPWICWARIWITHDEHSVIFIVVQNLVGIDAVFFIICRFQYLHVFNVPILI